MTEYRTLIDDSNLLLKVIEIPEEIQNKKVELFLRIVQEEDKPQKAQKRELYKANLNLNGYKFDREEANER